MFFEMCGFKKSRFKIEFLTTITREGQTMDVNAVIIFHTATKVVGTIIFVQSSSYNHLRCNNGIPNCRFEDPMIFLAQRSLSDPVASV